MSSYHFNTAFAWGGGRDASTTMKQCRTTSPVRPGQSIQVLTFHQAACSATELRQAPGA